MRPRQLPPAVIVDLRGDDHQDAAERRADHLPDREGRFQRPGGQEPLLRITDVETSHGRLTTLISGDGPEQVICLHGLGSNKASFFETVAALAPTCTVHALDLPRVDAAHRG